MLRIPLPSAAHSGAYIPEDDGFALAVSDDKRRGEIKDVKDFNDIKDAPKRLSFKSPFVPSHTTPFSKKQTTGLHPEPCQCFVENTLACSAVALVF